MICTCLAPLPIYAVASGTASFHARTRPPGLKVTKRVRLICSCLLQFINFTSLQRLCLSTPVTCLNTHTRHQIYPEHHIPDLSSSPTTVLDRNCTYTSYAMSVVSLLGVKIQNNPAKFTDNYEFEITFECLDHLQKGTHCGRIP